MRSCIIHNLPRAKNKEMHLIQFSIACISIDYDYTINYAHFKTVIFVSGSLHAMLIFTTFRSILASIKLPASST